MRGLAWVQALLAGIGLAVVLWAAPAAAQERILAYHSLLEVQADGSLEVTETIRVRAEGREIRRGIYRDFPTRYRDRAGNRVVVAPSPAYPLVATDFYQVLDTSDVPGGVVNIVTGEREELTKTLAEHDDVDAVWYFGTKDGGRAVEEASAGNLKQTWVEDGAARNWGGSEGQGRLFLARATQVKNIWIPYGE